MVVDTFEGLKRLGKCDDWQVVVRHCDLLARIDTVEFHKIRVRVQEEDAGHSWNRPFRFSGPILESGFLIEPGSLVPWYDYWLRAKEWAIAQLSPNEYRELRRQDERDASEGRLKRYFFGDNWSNWPQKARDRLINLDTLWFSESRGLDFGAILNDLQVALESMCYEFIWEPLRRAERGQEFKRKEAELSRESNSPTLADYRWICGRSFFKEIVGGAQLAEEDRRFLLQRLPRSLKRLYDSRNWSQHDPSIRLQRQDVEPFVREFLGIGQPGVLRRLAEIGPKLARR